MTDRFEALATFLFPTGRRIKSCRRWQDRWKNLDGASPWMNRGISKEIEAAVSDGWYNPGSLALDLGCGEADVAYWLAQRGFRAVGVDIAPATIARAKAKHAEMPGQLEFLVHDLCAKPLPLQNVNCFIDRGCFHTIAPGDVDAYVRNIAAVAASDARLLMYIRAFRNNTGRSKSDEQAAILENISRAFAPSFRLVGVAETNLGGMAPDGSQHQLPGIVLWLARSNHVTN